MVGVLFKSAGTESTGLPAGKAFTLKMGQSLWPSSLMRLSNLEFKTYLKVFRKMRIKMRGLEASR